MIVKLNFLKLPTQNEFIDLSKEEIDLKNELIPIGKSGIHIKKENRGKFTEYCGGKVTDECINKGKHSSDPKIRKQATFAKNARAWKHQFGGNLIPMQDVDFKGLLIDLEAQPSEFELKNNSDKNFKVNSKQYKIIKNSNSESSIEQQIPTWLSTTYNGGTGGLTVATQGNSNINSNVPEKLSKAINPYLGLDFKLGGNPQNGQIDCSGFASRVMKGLGKSAYGNCRDLWKQTQRIEKKDIQPGDLVFLQNTQPGRFGSGVASHVAVVTDISDLANGKIGVAQANRTGTKSDYGVWDINKSNYLGAGRSAKNGMKFQEGGIIKELLVDPQTEMTEYDRKLQELKNKYQINNDEFLIESPKNKVKKDLDSGINNEDNISSWFNTTYFSPSSQITPVSNNQNYSTYKGYDNFKKEFDNYLKSDPDAKKYENILTAIAKHESGFNSSVQNKGGYPAFGYFQFIEDGNINNISRYTGLSIEQFRNNPSAQIKAAVQMAKNIEKQFNKEDIELAKSKGYNMNAMIQGAWLGGVGGVKKYLKTGYNPSDGHSRISDAMDRGNKI